MLFTLISFAHIDADWFQIGYIKIKILWFLINLTWKKRGRGWKEWKEIWKIVAIIFIHDELIKTKKQRIFLFPNNFYFIVSVKIKHNLWMHNEISWEAHYLHLLSLNWPCSEQMKNF